ncbi:MAG: hypothetical protein WC444_06020 [Candidatus Paceibacterota bacterium]
MSRTVKESCQIIDDELTNLANYSKDKKLSFDDWVDFTEMAQTLTSKLRDIRRIIKNKTKE